MKKIVQCVLDSVASSAGDVTVSGGKVSIEGCPSFEHGKVVNYTLQKSITEQVERKSAKFTSAANSTRYQCAITQLIDGKTEQFLVDYTSDASATDAEVENALVAQVQAMIDGGALKATVAAASNGILVTGIANYPTLNIVGAENLTVASEQSYADNATQSGSFFAAVVSALAGTTTVTVTSNGHSLTEGMKVKVSGYGGTMDGQAGSVGVTARVTTVAANTFVLDGVVGASLTLSSTRVEVVATEAFGSGVDLAAQQVPGITSGNTYTRFTVDYRSFEGKGTPNEANRTLELYINEGDADADDLIDRLVEIENGYAAGTTNADPALIAK